MHTDGEKLLNLMFRPSETVCVSNSQFAYHSIPLEETKKEFVTLVSPNPEVAHQKTNTDDLLLVSLNPINGFRNDRNVISFRNFLVEIDAGSIRDQYGYIETMGMPYSAMVFSGNKSLHTLISLSLDLPDYKTYKKIARWILNTMTLADKNTANPSRSIRIPGAIRDTGKPQTLIKFNGPVDFKDLRDWLYQHLDAMPRPKVYAPPSEAPNFDKLPRWVIPVLKKGLDPSRGRNQQWFSISCEFYLAGFDLSATISILGQFFTPEHDFKEEEWLTAIKSGYTYKSGS